MSILEIAVSVLIIVFLGSFITYLVNIVSIGLPGIFGIVLLIIIGILTIKFIIGRNHG